MICTYSLLIYIPKMKVSMQQMWVVNRNSDREILTIAKLHSLEQSESWNAKGTSTQVFLAIPTKKSSNACI